jgi:thermitase
LRRTLLTLGLVAAILTSALSSVASGEEVGVPTNLRLSDDTVVVNGRLTIRGRNLLAAKKLYQVTVAGTPAWPDKWTDAAVEFLVPPTDRGVQQVELEPLEGTKGVPLVVGEVDISKAMPPPPGVEFVAGRVLLRLAPGADPAGIASSDDQFEKMFPDSPDPRLQRWYRVAVADGLEAGRINDYALLDEVEVAEYDPITRTDRAPTDPSYASDQWNVRITRLTAAWEVQTAGAGVAIVDTGIRPTHEELVGLVTQNRDMTGTGVQPCDSHGTHVAGIAGARANNARGIAGSAWAPNIGMYKALGYAGCTGTGSQLASAITAAVVDGFRIINMSLTLSAADQVVADAVAGAWAAGAVLVAAAGNNNSSTARYPAAYPNVLAVANSTSTDARNSSSNWGGWVDVAAPGTSILSSTAASDTSYAYFTGTSMSSPLVAGIASLLRGRGLNNAAAVNAITSNTDPVNWGSTGIAAGRVNAYRALGTSGCLRDIPNGAWVHRAATGAIYHVQSAMTLRYVGDTSIMDNWGAWGDMVSICEERFAEMVVGPSWGFRPGSVIHDTGIGAVYLVTSDGDRGLPVKRRFADPAVLACMGFTWPHQNVSSGTANIHPTGPDITADSCPPLLPRKFPNGSWIHHPSTGKIYVVDNGAKRYVPSLDMYASWMSGPGSGFVSVTDLEAALLPDGPPWGFRQGRLVQRDSVGTLYFVTDDGALRAQGSRRAFTTLPTFRERGFEGVPVVYNVGGNLDIHPEGAVLNDADDML